MKILSFSPYARGRSHENLITLLGAYLSQQNQKIDSLLCNGCFATCERDLSQSWQKSFSKCFSCVSAQQSALNFQDLNHFTIGKFLEPAEVELSKRLIAETSASELSELTWLGKIKLFDLCAGSFEARFGHRDLKLGNRQQEDYARTLMVTALRQFIAVTKIIIDGKYQLSFVPDGSDVLTCSFVCAARNAAANPVIFKYDRLDGNVFVINPQSFEIKVCEKIPANIADLSNDSADWSQDLIEQIKEVLVFLNYESEQLSLPLMGNV